MSDRAKLLKVTAIITSSLVLLSLILLLIISSIDRFTIFPYFSLLISILPCGILWKIYADEKKRNIK